MLTLPLNTRLLLSQNYSLFCHEWKRVSHQEVVISSSLEELAPSSLSSLPSSSIKAFGEGDGEAVKPPRQARRHAIRPTQVFTWHNSSIKVSRRASMRWSCVMMASRVTSPVEEEGGRNSRRCRTCRLHMRPLRSKLSLASSNRTSVDDTHGGIVRRIKNRDGKMAKDPHDSWRKNELITGRCILININDRSDKMRGEVNGKIL